MEDHYAAARRLLDAAEREAVSLRSQVQRLTLDAHTLKRQAERTQQANARLQARISRLEVEREQATDRAAASARAMSEHAGRVA
jgi:septal ring factor EnvC (AmiA/AmiB activator)